MSRIKPAGPSIFELLDNMQTKNRAYYRSLTEEQKAAFHPLTVMRWLATVPNDDQVLVLNEMANTKVFALSHSDKTLMMDVLSACTTGRTSRFKWVKRPSTAKSPIDDVFMSVYGADVDLQHAHSTHTSEDIVALCHSLGMQDREVQAVLKHVKS